MSMTSSDWEFLGLFAITFVSFIMSVLGVVIIFEKNKLLGAVSLLILIYLVPIGLIMFLENNNFQAANLVYFSQGYLFLLGVFKVLAIAVLIVGSGVGIIFLVFKSCKALRDTWLGQILLAAKKEICPSLVKCPVKYAETLGAEAASNKTESN